MCNFQFWERHRKDQYSNLSFIYYPGWRKWHGLRQLLRNMELTSQPETLFQPESSNFEERRKRKANDIDTYHHPLIEFEATGKLLFNLSFLILGLFQCIAEHQIKLLFHNTWKYCSTNPFNLHKSVSVKSLILKFIVHCSTIIFTDYDISVHCPSQRSLRGTSFPEGESHLQGGWGGLHLGPDSDGQWSKMSLAVAVIGMTLCQICLSVIYEVLQWFWKLKKRDI